MSNYFLANGLGIETKEYNLIPEQEWQVDLDHMESIIGEPFKNRTSSHLRPAEIHYLASSRISNKWFFATG